MDILEVRGQKPYKIFIENKLILYAPKKIKLFCKSGKVVVLTDHIVEKIYLDDLVRSLENEGFEVYKFSFKPGECSKTLDTVIEIYKFLCENQISKSDILISLGGGVVGDITGFVASTYMRGIKFINIPTTLLSQVDSCLGGKTGVNLSFGKNLVGTFYSPEAVFIDPLFLKTLDHRTFLDGMGEVIKYALICDKDLFLKLENEFENGLDLTQSLKYVISKCLFIKKDLVEKDEFDNKERMMLNFGHTLGHAIEKYYNFEKYSHGQAISIGMFLITYFSEKNGITQKGTFDRLKNILEKYHLLYDEWENIKDFVEISLNDKKIRDNNMNIVLLREIGDGYIQSLKVDEFKKFLLGGRSI